MLFRGAMFVAETAETSSVKSQLRSMDRSTSQFAQIAEGDISAMVSQYIVLLIAVSKDARLGKIVKSHRVLRQLDNHACL